MSESDEVLVERAARAIEKIRHVGGDDLIAAVVAVLERQETEGGLGAALREDDLDAAEEAITDVADEFCVSPNQIRTGLAVLLDDKAVDE